jgi:uncharacterized membrane protein YjfL (UPF0719 family)
MKFGYNIFDKITPFNNAKELQRGNIPIGIVIGCIFISLGITTGLIIGMALF